MVALHTLVTNLVALDLSSVELLDALVFYVTDAASSWLRRVRTSTFVREFVREFMLIDTDGGRHVP